MSSHYIVALGTFMFIAESAVRLSIYRGGERAGHSVAWGVVRGITLSCAERTHRIWAVWFPHLIMLVMLPTAVGFGELTLAMTAQDPVTSRLLYLYGYLLLLSGLGAAIGVPLLIIGTSKRIRADRLGFVSEHQAASKPERGQRPVD